MGATWRKMDPHVAPAIGRKRVEFKDDKSPSRDKNELRLLPASYFTLESLFLLVCLTASLLILPLVLPPLPPPPFMLLLIPIGILGLLMVLALMPSEAIDLSYSDI
ncbi:hypothetical protein SAY86_022158 [Trapa natans]|uniref:ARGOS-like protein n=1 Tax=Trapa natans TaxID=22666 RepID=A0AAN7ME58_TRANT|nr:hypothetical protein SAY86_022158 [Trapa natans]